MRIADEINDLKEIVGISPELLVCRVAEAFEKFESNEATEQDRFVLGLRWSEFYTDSTSDTEYLRAEHKRQIYCNKLGVDPDWLRIQLLEKYNLA